jgi:hypothetical protein
MRCRAYVVRMACELYNADALCLCAFRFSRPCSGVWRWRPGGLLTAYPHGDPRSVCSPYVCVCACAADVHVLDAEFEDACTHSSCGWHLRVCGNLPVGAIVSLKVFNLLCAASM